MLDAVARLLGCCCWQVCCSRSPATTCTAAGLPLAVALLLAPLLAAHSISWMLLYMRCRWSNKMLLHSHPETLAAAAAAAATNVTLMLQQHPSCSSTAVIAVAGSPARPPPLHSLHHCLLARRCAADAAAICADCIASLLPGTSASIYSAQQSPLSMGGRRKSASAAGAAPKRDRAVRADAVATATCLAKCSGSRMDAGQRSGGRWPSVREGRAQGDSAGTPMGVHDRLLATEDCKCLIASHHGSCADVYKPRWQPRLLSTQPARAIATNEP